MQRYVTTQSAEGRTIRKKGVEQGKSWEGAMDTVDSARDLKNYNLHLWHKVYPLQVIVPPMVGNGRLLR